MISAREVVYWRCPACRFWVGYNQIIYGSHVLNEPTAEAMELAVELHEQRKHGIR